MSGLCDLDELHCITCSDEGIAMRVTTASDETAECRDDAGMLHDVAIELVSPVAADDVLLVHAGVAIRHLGAADLGAAA